MKMISTVSWQAQRGNLREKRLAFLAGFDNYQNEGVQIKKPA
jgi:hypothetical protein